MEKLRQKLRSSESQISRNNTRWGWCNGYIQNGILRDSGFYNNNATGGELLSTSGNTTGTSSLGMVKGVIGGPNGSQTAGHINILHTSVPGTSVPYRERGVYLANGQ